MARFYGSSGCTSQLVRELRALGVPSVDTFPQIETLFDSIDRVLAEQRAHEEQVQRAAAESARSEASTLEQPLVARVRELEVELASERDRLPGEIEILASEISLRHFKGILHAPRWLKLRHRHRTLSRHLNREARRPFRRDLAQVERLRATAANIERDLLATVETRVAPYVRARQYFESHSTRNTFFGAKGEELVLDALRALPDDFTIISDVNMDLGRSVRWRARPGTRVRRAQIDHVVVGPGCVFLLETKNWSTDTVSRSAVLPFEQVSRAAYVFYLLAQSRFRRRRMRRRDVVVHLHDRSTNWTALGRPYQYVTQVPVNALAAFVTSQPRHTAPGAVTAPETVSWLLQG